LLLLLLALALLPSGSALGCSCLAFVAGCRLFLQLCFWLGILRHMLLLLLLC
jgi:hypothetical protein